MHIDNVTKVAGLAKQREDTVDLLFDLKGGRTEGQSAAYLDRKASVYFDGRSCMYLSAIANMTGLTSEELSSSMTCTLVEKVERRLQVIENELSGFGVVFQRISRAAA